MSRDNLTVCQVEEQADELATPSSRLPDVFTEAPPNTIPIFNSLDAFRDYMFAMREQVQREKAK